MDDFFASYYGRRPVHATFIGVHDLDNRLPDLSEHGLGDTAADMEDLLRRSEALRAAEASPVERVDLRLARGFLRIELHELASGHFQRGNPSLYTGEAVFGVISLFLSDFAPLGERIEAAVERLRAVPTILSHCRENVRQAPAAWTRRALGECAGALAFLGEGIDHLGSLDPSRAPSLRRAADRAAVAFEALARTLRQDLLPRARVSVAAGEEALDLYLREGHALDTPAGEIAAEARDALERVNAALREGAARFGAESPAEALAGLADAHPPVERYYDRYGEVWQEVRALAEERALVTWPDAPIRFVPRPVWARAAAPSLYFLFYRSPAAFGAPEVHDHLVTPIEPDLPPGQRDALLRAHNDAVIKLNHVIHHGGIGHHVQNAHARRSPSRVGRVAAVDCASRIAMFCGGTMAEGWACYATDLVQEAGGLTPLEVYAELGARARMCARAVVDVALHARRMTLDDAAAFYQREGGMGGEAAHAEAVRNSMFPGTALMYRVGAEAIHALRRTVREREGAAFDLRRFHDRLLSWGSVPVSIAGELLEAGVGTAHG
jgi:hypothetical protein